MLLLLAGTTHYRRKGCAAPGRERWNGVGARRRHANDIVLPFFRLRIARKQRWHSA